MENMSDFHVDRVIKLIKIAVTYLFNTHKTTDTNLRLRLKEKTTILQSLYHSKNFHSQLQSPLTTKFVFFTNLSMIQEDNIAKY